MDWDFGIVCAGCAALGMMFGWWWRDSLGPFSFLKK